MSGDPTDLTLAQVAEAIAHRKLSSVEVTEASIARIRRWQPHINAFIRLDEEEALRAAAERDQEIARGRIRGPLHGVPLAHKDLFFRRGKITTAGSKLLRNYHATATATVLDRMDAAGAIDLGSLNMAEFAAGPTGHNIHFGHCRNPYDGSRVSGGSSSGSGAAVAAHLIFGALGSDTGGSIRLPASACGVVGLKPTYGRVSRYGVVPRSWSLDHVGPLARTAADCAMLLQVVAGRDPRDPTTSTRPVPNMSAALGSFSLKGLRIGVPEDFFLADLESQVAATLQASLAVLRDAGAEIRKVPLPELAQLADLAETIIKSEAAAIHRQWLASRPLDYANQVRVRIEVGFLIPATQYLDALRLRQIRLKAFVLKTMADVHLLHVPTIPFPVPTIEETDVENVSGADLLAVVRGMTTFTRPFNFLGLPAMTIPCGSCRNGLPIAFQLIGRPFDEALLLATSAAYERAAGRILAAPELPATESHEDASGRMSAGKALQ